MFEPKESSTHFASALDTDIERAWHEWVYTEEKIR